MSPKKLARSSSLRIAPNTAQGVQIAAFLAFADCSAYQQFLSLADPLDLKVPISSPYPHEAFPDALLELDHMEAAGRVDIDYYSMEQAGILGVAI